MRRCIDTLGRACYCVKQSFVHAEQTIAGSLASSGRFDFNADFDFFARIGSPHESTHILSWLIGKAPTDFQMFVERLVAASNSATMPSD